LSEDLAGDYRAMAFDLSQANQPSADAAIAFDIAHGNAFRQECPTRRGQSYLRPQISEANGQWVWAVAYINRRENDPTQYMSGEIDWATGSIDQVVDADLPCDG
jgi:hypothetical protein